MQLQLGNVYGKARFLHPLWFSCLRRLALISMSDHLFNHFRRWLAPHSPHHLPLWLMVRTKIPPMFNNFLPCYNSFPRTCAMEKLLMWLCNRKWLHLGPCKHPCLLLLVTRAWMPSLCTQVISELMRAFRSSYALIFLRSHATRRCQADHDAMVTYYFKQAIWSMSMSPLQKRFSHILFHTLSCYLATILASRTPSNMWESSASLCP